MNTGTYDTVWVPCPSCGHKNGCQSKSGPCHLLEFELDTAPADVLIDINRYSPYTCMRCDTAFALHLTIVPVPVSLGTTQTYNKEKRVHGRPNKLSSLDKLGMGPNSSDIMR